MKTHASLYLASLISLSATAVCLAEDPIPTASPAAPAPAAAAPVAPAPVIAPSRPPSLPYPVTEVIKMYQGGISKDILVGFAQSSMQPFHLTADNIIYLQHLGLPQEVTAAMIHRDGDLQNMGAAAYQQQQQMAPPADAAAYNQAPPAQAAPAVVAPSGPPPSVDPYPAVVGAPPVVAYPDYSAYPYYYGGYPYYYGPNVYIGGGWGYRGGWGWGGRGGWGGGRGGWHR